MSVPVSGYFGKMSSDDPDMEGLGGWSGSEPPRREREWSVGRPQSLDYQHERDTPSRHMPVPVISSTAVCGLIPSGRGWRLDPSFRTYRFWLSVRSAVTGREEKIRMYLGIAVPSEAQALPRSVHPRYLYRTNPRPRWLCGQRPATSSPTLSLSVVVSTSLMSTKADRVATPPGSAALSNEGSPCRIPGSGVWA